MKRVHILFFALILIITACHAGGSDDPQATAESSSTPLAPGPPTAPATVAASSTPTVAVIPSPTATMSPTATVEAVSVSPSSEVCLHSHPYFRPEFYVMNSDGTEVRRIDPEGMIDAWDPAWSPDGTQIVFAGYDGQDDGIFVMDLDGTNVRRLTDGDGDSTEPAWSPDGARIAFVRQLPDPGGTHLYVVDSDGSNLRQLTSLAGRVGAPDWSPRPEGTRTRIVFASDQDGDLEIYSIDAEGEGLTQLTDRPTWDYAPVWSDDGQRITFSSGYFGTEDQFADESEIGTFTMKPDGSDVRKIEGFEVDDSDLRWSPDGEQIAFVHDFEIMVVDSDGGVRRNLTQHLLTDTWPRWSPDGQSILFLSQRDLWTRAEPGPGRPEAVVLRAGDVEQAGGFGTYCEPIENGLRGQDVYGVWMPPEPLIAEVGTSLSFDARAIPELSALEIIVYDYDEAQRVGKLTESVLTPPCAPPGGTESACLKGHISASSPMIEVPNLPPGHYALIVRANFGSGFQRGYTEQGFNLIVR